MTSVNTLKIILNNRTQILYIQPKLVYRSRAGSHFYGTEYEIWDDFGLVGNTEKKFMLLLRVFFNVFISK
jgi:hypothetical protein